MTAAEQVESGELVLLRLFSDGITPLVGACDQAPSVPFVSEVNADAADGGRGLFLVAALAGSGLERGAWRRVRLCRPGCGQSRTRTRERPTGHSEPAGRSAFQG